MTNHDDDAARDATGRFRKGVCPNPKGRPRKAKPDFRQQLTAILQEEVMAGGRTMSMFEVLLRTLCRDASKDSRLLLRLLPLVMTGELSAEPAHEVSLEEDLATVEAFRQADRDRVKRAPKDGKEDGDAVE